MATRAHFKWTPLLFLLSVGCVGTLHAFTDLPCYKLLNLGRTEQGLAEYASKLLKAVEVKDAKEILSDPEAGLEFLTRLKTLNRLESLDSEFYATIARKLRLKQYEGKPHLILKDALSEAEARLGKKLPFSREALVEISEFLEGYKLPAVDDPNRWQNAGTLIDKALKKFKPADGQNLYLAVYSVTTSFFANGARELLAASSFESKLRVMGKILNGYLKKFFEKQMEKLVEHLKEGGSFSEFAAKHLPDHVPSGANGGKGNKTVVKFLTNILQEMGGEFDRIRISGTRIESDLKRAILGDLGHLVTEFREAKKEAEERSRPAPLLISPAILFQSQRPDGPISMRPVRVRQNGKEEDHDSAEAPKVPPPPDPKSLEEAVAIFRGLSVSADLERQIRDYLKNGKEEIVIELASRLQEISFEGPPKQGRHVKTIKGANGLWQLKPSTGIEKVRVFFTFKDGVPVVLGLEKIGFGRLVDQNKHVVKYKGMTQVVR